MMNGIGRLVTRLRLPHGKALRGDDLAYATLAYIRDHPRDWDQAAITGVRACFIGRAVMISGASRDPDTLGAGARLLGWTRADARTVYNTYTRDYATLERLVLAIIRAGNIGKKVKEVELDPGIAEPAPVAEPAAPEREPEPVPELEPVPG